MMGKEAEMRKMRDSRIKKENEGWGVVRTSKKSSSLAHILTVLWESRQKCFWEFKIIMTMIIIIIRRNC